MGDLRPAFVTDKEVVRERAKWWQSEMTGKIDTHTRMDPGAPFLVGSGGPALSARAPGARDRISGQELTEEEERNFADLAYKAKARELEAREHFKVSPPEKSGTRPKDLVDKRWPPTWKDVDGEKTAIARLVTTGYKDPVLRTGNVGTVGCVSRR